MKKLTTAAVLVAAALAASQSAFATQSLVANNLYMGFENAAGGGTSDYIINLGAASGIVGQTTVQNFSSDFSLSMFDDSTLQGTTPSDIKGGVVGGSNDGDPSDVYATLLRSSNIGDWSVAGSAAPPAYTRGQINAAYTPLTSLNVPTTVGGALDSTKSWENQVEPTLTASTFVGNAFNPDSAVSTSTVLYEDLWEVANSSTRGTEDWVYDGYFTLDLTGSQPSLTFTGADVAAVPEPGTYGFLAVAGLLLLGFRRQLKGKLA